MPNTATHYGVGPAENECGGPAPQHSAWQSLDLASRSCRADRPTPGNSFGLALLSIPTALLASLPDLQTFTLMRIARGSACAALFPDPCPVWPSSCSAKALPARLAICRKAMSPAIFLAASSAPASPIIWHGGAYLCAVNLVGAILVLAALPLRPSRWFMNRATLSRWLPNI